MAEKTIKVVALFKLKPESREWAVQNPFKQLVEKTRAEKGCISYHLYNESSDTNSFVFVEEWKS